MTDAPNVYHMNLYDGLSRRDRRSRLGPAGRPGARKSAADLVEKSPWERAESYAPDLHELLRQREDVRGDLRVIAWGVAAALWSVLIFLVARSVGQ